MPGPQPQRPAQPQRARFTSRAAVLAVVVCAIALSLAYPVREYIAQRRQIDQLVAQSQATSAELARLRAEAAAAERPGLHRAAGPRPAAQVHAPADLLRDHRRPAGQQRARPRRTRARRGTSGCGTRCTRRTSPAPGETVAGLSAVTAADEQAVQAQLGRPPRALRGVAHRCPCGLPDVVQTAPRLADGTPFPTLFYLTCPRAVAAVSRLEAAGVMREMQQRLASQPGLRAAQQAAHRDYLARRAAAAAEAGVEPLPAGTQSAGGMPDRVKCLHALVAHELAVPGANPLGREAADAAGEWWAQGPCVATGCAR